LRRGREVDGAADRRAAADEIARRRIDLAGKGQGRGRVAQHLPVDRQGLLAVVGPLHHGHGDAQVAGRLDRGVDGRVPEGVGQALHLQTELVGRNR
jgi:hypothetical protein